MNICKNQIFGVLLYLPEIQAAAGVVLAHVSPEAAAAATCLGRVHRLELGLWPSNLFSRIWPHSHTIPMAKHDFFRRELSKMSITDPTEIVFHFPTLTAKALAVS